VHLRAWGKGPGGGDASAGIGKGPVGGQQRGGASAGIGKGPQGRAAAWTQVRGNRERAPGAGGSIDARPRASGKGPGAGRGRTRICGHRERARCVGSAGIRKGPRGWAVGGTHGQPASGKGKWPGGGWGGDARPRASGDTGIVHNKLIIFELATEI
jgi:hypothetical protein